MAQRLKRRRSSLSWPASNLDLDGHIRRLDLHVLDWSYEVEGTHDGALSGVSDDFSFSGVVVLPGRFNSMPVLGFVQACQSESTDEGLEELRDEEGPVRASRLRLSHLGPEEDPDFVLRLNVGQSGYVRLLRLFSVAFATNDQTLTGANRALYLRLSVKDSRKRGGLSGRRLGDTKNLTSPSSRLGSNESGRNALTMRARLSSFWGHC